jgi:hypothetical protein
VKVGVLFRGEIAWLSQTALAEPLGSEPLLETCPDVGLRSQR